MDKDNEIKDKMKISNAKKSVILGLLEIPDGITVKVEGNMIFVTGNSTESREIKSKSVKIVIDGNQLRFSARKDNKITRKIIGTLKAHIKNMFKGVTKGHYYKLKICSGHFPMNVSVSKNELTVKNFLGERVPRTMTIKEGVKIKVEGGYVIVESPSKELAGQTAALIETLTRRVNYDKRIFQDGIYLVEKDGKEI